MYGELRLAIDRLAKMPKNQVWFIPVFVNKAEIPSLNISDRETLDDIHAISLYADWDVGLRDILRSMRLDDPDHRRALYLIDLIRHHPDQRTYAIDQLANMPHYAIPVLIAALRDADVKVKLSAAEGLVQIGKDAIPALIEALRDPELDGKRSCLRYACPHRIGCSS